MSILGAAHYSPNVTLRGEIGASLVKKRVIKWENKLYKRYPNKQEQITKNNIMDYSN